MLNFIESIPGPLFLLYYIILMVACFGLAWFLLNAPDGSTAYRLPLSKRHSPMAIAILNNGESDAIELSIFSLWHKGLLRFKQQKGGDLIQRVPNWKEKEDGLSAVEQELDRKSVV